MRYRPARAAERRSVIGVVNRRSLFLVAPSPCSCWSAWRAEDQSLQNACRDLAAQFFDLTDERRPSSRIQFSTMTTSGRRSPGLRVVGVTITKRLPSGVTPK
jgi:hypothetical protein